jgi:hypothetical protein
MKASTVHLAVNKPEPLYSFTHHNFCTQRPNLCKVGFFTGIFFVFLRNLNFRGGALKYYFQSWFSERQWGIAEIISTFIWQDAYDMYNTVSCLSNFSRWALKQRWAKGWLIDLPIPFRSSDYLGRYNRNNFHICRLCLQNFSCNLQFFNGPIPISRFRIEPLLLSICIGPTFLSTWHKPLIHFPIFVSGDCIGPF